MATIQPPVQLSADMDKSQQASFINQNFQSMATYLQSDFLKVVKTGTVTGTGTATTTNPGAGNFVSNQFTLATVSHGLGYIPAVLAYIYTGTGYGLMPSMSFSGVSAANGGWFNFYTEVDTTNLYFYLQIMRYGSSTSLGLSGFSFKYYLLQETAN